MQPDDVPSWVGPALSWATVLCVAIAAVVLAYDAKWLQRSQSWFLDYFWTGSERRIAKSLDDFHKPYPDWSIRDLFIHIDPHVLDIEGRIKTVGRDILDKFCTGSMTCYGRPLPRENNFVESFTFDGSSLKPIPREHWDGAQFTYRFFDEHASDVPHTSPAYGSSTPRYADLNVKRADALNMWPTECRLNAL